MPYAYDWLTEQQKKSITEIKILLDSFQDLRLHLHSNSSDEKRIHYKTNGRFSSVYDNDIETLVVKHHFVDVFLEDLEILLEHQETVVDLHFIFFSRNFFYAESAKVSESLEKCLEALKTRNSALKVKSINFDKTHGTFGWTLLKYLNPEVLRSVRFDRLSKPVNFGDVLNEFRILEEGYRFALFINAREIDENDLIFINEFTSFSAIFSKLRITSESLEPSNDSIWNDEDFNTKFKKKRVGPHGCFIMFPNEENTKPEKPSSSETETRSQFSPVRSVFENPLRMEPILKRLECFEIQRLRKVTRGVRECIDTVKPDPRIEKYSISFYSAYECNLPVASIELESGNHKEVIYSTFKNKLYDNAPERNSTDLCLNDFEANLSYQKSCMEELSIGYGWSREYERLVAISYRQLPMRIGGILKRRENPLKTRKFSMGFNSQMEVMEILPAIDTNFLEIIEFMCPIDMNWMKYAKFEELTIEVDQLSQTDQWKNAQQLISKFATITTPIQDMNILYFANLEILLNTLSSQDVDYLRTNLLKSLAFQKFEIFFRKSSIDESLHTLIGEPYRIISDVKKVWYFRMEHTDYYIHISLDTSDVLNEKGNLKPKLIIFTRVAEEDTPFFAMGMDGLAIN